MPVWDPESRFVSTYAAPRLVLPIPMLYRQSDAHPDENGHRLPFASLKYPEKKSDNGFDAQSNKVQGDQSNDWRQVNNSDGRNKLTERTQIRLNQLTEKLADKALLCIGEPGKQDVTDNHVVVYLSQQIYIFINFK